MTPYSVRRPDGYCLNELTFAIIRRIRIVPVMVVDVEPPLSITRIQWLDLRDCVPIDERAVCYERKLPVLLSALENSSGDFEGMHARLISALRPISYEEDIEYHLPRFTGRGWLFRRIDDWLADPHGAPVFWITGGPGSGKSAIAAYLCARRPEVAAFHICKFSSSLKADPAQAVRSIAWQLSTQLPNYFTRLVNIPNLEDACETRDASTLFDLLIIQPLHNLPAPDHVVIVVIDAVDEATRLGNNELAGFLANETARLPDWMRLIVTSRPEIEVTQHLQSLDPLTLAADSTENTEDIVDYIQTYIAPHAAEGAISAGSLASLLDTSQQNWLYIEWIRRELEAERLSLSKPEEFPRGLGGFYCQFFKRRIPDPDEYKRFCRPFLELEAAACEPPLKEDLARALNWTQYTLNDVLRTLGSLLDRAGQHVCLFHRSVRDWLMDPALAGDYLVDPVAGHRAFASAGWGEYRRGVANMSAYMRQWLPAHLDAAGHSDELALCITDAEFIGDAFLDGRRHFDFARFWGHAGSPDFARACEASYDRGVQNGWPDERMSAAARGMGQLFQHCGVYERATAYFEKALTISLAGGDADAVGFSHLDVAWCCRHTEKFERAVTHVESAIERFHASGNRGGAGRAESIKGVCLWHLQQDLPALKHLERARSLCAEAGDDRGEAETLNYLGIVYRSLGQYERALECLQETESFYTSIKDLRGLGTCCNSMGTVYLWSSQYDRALSYYEKANHYNLRTNQHYVAGLTANNLGYLYLETGQYQKAHDSFARARSIRRQLQTEGYEMMDLSGLALAFHHMRDARAARRLSQEALDGLRTVKSVEDLVRAYHNHYVIMKDGGQADAESAARALLTAEKLVADRIGRISDPHVRSKFIAGVPLIRELAERGASSPLSPPDKPAKVKMPDVRDQNAAAAENYLKKLGFTNIDFGSQDEYDTLVLLPENLTVKKQSTKVGRKIPTDMLIVLTCARTG
jgi:tetratricopeptide (TPR) repeat protein